MDRANALAEIQNIFGTYKSLTANELAWLQGQWDGKVYELYCLSKVIEELVNTYGFSASFVGSDIQFKLSPGRIRPFDPHFQFSYGGQDYCLYTDIEFQTLGASNGGNSDLSRYHEIDLILVESHVSGMPDHDDIILGVECKSTANFDKSIIKEVLGIRREMCLINPDFSKLSAAVGQRKLINASPASEYWLAFVDHNGMNYSSSPSVFSIDFKHWQP